MKLFTIFILSLALLSTLGASKIDKTLAANMMQMENGLNGVQKGFLYNDVMSIKEGIALIKSANTLFHNRRMTTKYLPDNKKHMTNVAYNSAMRIDQYSDETLAYLKEAEYSKAHHAYSEILNACGACHAIVRNW